MMKYSLILFLGVFALSPLIGQEQPVRWSYAAEALGENEYELRFTAEIREGWYLYSQYLSDGGPIPTTIAPEESPLYTLKGDMKEDGKAIEGMDELFGIAVKKFKERAVFTQRVEVKEGLQEISGYIEFMSCNDEMCLPPREIPFVIFFR